MCRSLVAQKDNLHSHYCNADKKNSLTAKYEYIIMVVAIALYCQNQCITVKGEQITVTIRITTENNEHYSKLKCTGCHRYLKILKFTFKNLLENCNKILFMGSS